MRSIYRNINTIGTLRESYGNPIYVFCVLCLDDFIIADRFQHVVHHLFTLPVASGFFLITI